MAESAGLGGFRVIGARGDATTIRDTIGHGAGTLDFDSDGRLDLVLTAPDRVQLFRNLGNWTFAPVDAGFRQAGWWGGIAVADVDGNGDPDLFLTGYGCQALYLNEAGRFREVTDPWGLQPPPGAHPSWGSSAGFQDLDGDGWVDLVICRYIDFGAGTPQRCATIREGVTSVCAPKVYEPQRPRVMRNVGGKRFGDVTDRWGIRGHGAALGVAFQDADNDGRPEVVIANDERPGDYFVKRGSRWVERGADSGLAYDREGRVHGGMGVDWGDADGDGLPDLSVMTFTGEDKSLYRNLGGGLFEDQAWRWGLTRPTRMDIAFGVRFLDFDRDGRLDLAIANGHIQENATAIREEAGYEQPFRLFRGVACGFEEVAPGGWPQLVGRALVMGDWDNDGAQDLLVGNVSGPPLLYRNRAKGGHWVGVSLRGRAPNTMALGARVTLLGASGRQVREVQTAGSYLSSGDPRLVFGLGASTAEPRIEVRWPGGRVTRHDSLKLDAWRTLHEPPN